MNAEIICVGTELLLGDILNTNAQYLSRKLSELGISVYSQSVVGDNVERLKSALIEALDRSEIVLLSGGLGPTPDDLTKETVAELLGLEMYLHDDVLSEIEEYFNNRNLAMPEMNKKQAMVPHTAMVVHNEHGTAPGLVIKKGKNLVIMLPGPPKELVPMFEKNIIPYFKKSQKGIIYSKNINILGVGESKVAEKLGALLGGNNPTVATYCETGEVRVRVTASGNNAFAKNAVTRTVKEITDMFGDDVYGLDEVSVASKVVKLLTEKGLKIATAESCTAGMISGMLTDVPGASGVFEMGITAYSNDIKMQALNISKALLDDKGAVSPEVAYEMASSIRKITDADIGLGITGEAGPTSGSDKPVGLIYISLTDGTNCFVKQLMLSGDRDKNRITASKYALDMVRRYLENRPSFMVGAFIAGGTVTVMNNYSEAETLPETEKPITLEDINLTPADGLDRSAFYDVGIKEVEEMPEETHTEAVEEVIETPAETVPDVPEVFEEIIEPQEEIIEEPAEELLQETEEPIVEETVEEPIVEETEEPEVIEETAEEVKEEPAVLEETAENTEKVLSRRERKKKTFLQKFLPNKKDSTGEKAWKILFIVALIGFIVAAGMLINYFAFGFSERNLIDNSQTSWEAPNAFQKNADGVFIGFEELIKQNPDIVGWIKVDGTNIDNPVYKTTDNDYYINHNMNKKQSKYGAVFADYQNIIAKEGNSQSVVLYGHHMSDGSMFASLKNYRNLDFYKTHPIIDFTTLYNKAKYKVFAVMITNATADGDNGNIFSYRYTHFSSGKAFVNYTKDVKARSMLNCNVDIIETDEIIALSTCVYDFKEARLVVFARKIRDGETGYMDTSRATYNSNCIYPAAYTNKGKKTTESTASYESLPSDLPEITYASDPNDISSIPVSSKTENNFDTNSELNSETVE